MSAEAVGRSDSRTAKGRERRAQVAAAASRLLVSDGFDALTHRRVAEAAEVPLGTTTYYFRDRAELTQAAVELVLDREHRRRSRVRVGDDSTTALAEALVALLVPQGRGSARDRTATVYERLAQALRDDALHELVDGDYRDLEEQTARLLDESGVDLAPERVLAVTEGRLMRWLASDRSLRELVDAVAGDLAVLTAA